MKQRKKRDADRKQRFCDPGACDECVYIGEGDFLCSQHEVVVVCGWTPTHDYMKCKKARSDRREGRQ